MESFKDWMAKVDAKVSTSVGLSAHDLPDFAYRDVYDIGYTPEEAAEEALIEAGWEPNGADTE